MVTNAQVRRLRQKLMEKLTQEAAAAAAGMSSRTARRWQSGPVPSEKKARRWWRTRPDPLAEVWEPEVVPLLKRDEKGVLRATTLLAVLREKRPGVFGDGIVRTLQRRMKEWRILNGQPKEVYFEQVHEPGRQGAFDFTHGTELGVTVQGKLFEHLFFEFVLLFSRWTYVALAFSETFEALVSGLQGALWKLDGVPYESARQDNLTAATHEINGGGRELNQRFKAVLDHYGLRSSRIRAGEAHENGSVEQRHYRTKQAIAEALVLRGSRDFESAAAYEAFAQEVVERTHNQKVAAKLAEERPYLRALPPARLPDYSTYRPIVHRWSTMRVVRHTYSVPSCLIGEMVEARVFADHVEVHYAGKLMETMDRIRGNKEHRIDYRHVIRSLVTKPAAFAHYRYREDLFPTLTFRRAYDALRETRGDRADVEYVRILHLAATTLESQVDQALEELLAVARPFDYADVRDRVRPETPTIPTLALPAPDLAVYDRLLVAGAA
jgi:hypothetical protein